MIMCPYCNIEVKESEIEADDGCCPECGAVISVSHGLLENPDYDNEQSEYDYEDDEELNGYDYLDEEDEDSGYSRRNLDDDEDFLNDGFDDEDSFSKDFDDDYSGDIDDLDDPEFYESDGDGDDEDAPKSRKSGKKASSQKKSK